MLIRLCSVFVALLLPLSVWAETSSIAALFIVDADTGEELLTLKEGDEISLSSIASRKITIVAKTSPPRVTRVVFGLDNFPRYRDETAPPYALAGDRRGQYIPWVPKIGIHWLTVTPYIRDEPGTSTKVSFRILPAKAVDESPEVFEPEPTASLPLAGSEPESEITSLVEVPITTPSPLPTEAESLPLSTPSETPSPTPAPLPSLVIEPTLEPSLMPTPSPTQSVTPAPSPSPSPTPRRTAEPTLRIDFSLAAQRVVPPSNSTATGRCVASVDQGQREVSLGCTHTIIGPTHAALYLGASGAEGDMICVFESADSPLVATCGLSEDQFSALLAGAVYLEIRSIAYGAGDLRGQLNTAQ